MPLFPHAKLRGWPANSGEPAPPAESLELSEALRGRFAFDAHFAAYAPVGFRLRKCVLHQLPANYDPQNALALAGGAVQMQLACFDCDDKLAHASDEPARLSWRLEFWRNALRALARHPGAFCYDTRGGARLLWRLPQPWPMSTPAHAQEWSCYYRGWCLYLSEAFGLQVDALHDWTRLFRLPGAARAGGASEERFRFGSPERLGAFELPAALEQELAARVRLQPAGSLSASSYPLRQGAPFNPLAAGLLPTLLWRRGWLGKEQQPGKWNVRCPGPGEEHGLASDTVVFASEEFGWIHCSHNRCEGWRSQGLAGALGLFSEAEVQAAASLCSGGLC